MYQAESWRRPQRVILVIVDCPDPKTGQLFLNWNLPQPFVNMGDCRLQRIRAEPK